MSRRWEDMNERERWLIQVEELGTLETPIALTNTLNVGLGVIAGGLLGSLLLKKASNKLITVMFAAVMAAAGVKMLFFP